MAAFIDTGIFVGVHNRRDQYHKAAKALMVKAVAGSFGELYTSDYVLDEVVAFIYAKTGDPALVVEAVNFIQNSGKVEILHVNESVFASAKMCVEQYSRMRLTLTDWVSANLMAEGGMMRILSFDDDFDKLKTIKRFSSIQRTSK